MERRILLVGLASGAASLPLAAGRALAQSSPAPATDAPAAPAPAPSAPETAPAMKTGMPASGVSEAVRAHLKDTMTVGSLSLLISRVGQQKLKHPMGKQFADFEVAEQNIIADILKGRISGGLRPMGTIKDPSDAELEGNLDQKGRDALAMFRAMKEGPDLEKAYIKAEIDGHQQLLDIQDSYLKIADDAEETSIAKMARGMIKEHLTLLADIQRHLG